MGAPNGGGVVWVHPHAHAHAHAGWPAAERMRWAIPAGGARVQRHAALEPHAVRRHARCSVGTPADGCGWPAPRRACPLHQTVQSLAAGPAPRRGGQRCGLTQSPVGRRARMGVLGRGPCRTEAQTKAATTIACAHRVKVGGLDAAAVAQPRRQRVHGCPRACACSAGPGQTTSTREAPSAPRGVRPVPPEPAHMYRPRSSAAWHIQASRGWAQLKRSAQRPNHYRTLLLSVRRGSARSLFAIGRTSLRAAQALAICRRPVGPPLSNPSRTRVGTHCAHQPCRGCCGPSAPLAVGGNARRPGTTRRGGWSLEGWRHGSWFHQRRVRRVGTLPTPGVARQVTRRATPTLARRQTLVPRPPQRPPRLWQPSSSAPAARRRRARHHSSQGAAAAAMAGGRWAASHQPAAPHAAAAAAAPARAQTQAPARAPAPAPAARASAARAAWRTSPTRRCGSC